MFVSLNNSESFLYSTKCTQLPLLTSCAVEPQNAIESWDLAVNPPTDPTHFTHKTYDGYVLSAQATNTTICANATCTQDNSTVFIVNQVVSNAWNMYREAFAGVVGLGADSALWSLLPPDAPKSYLLDPVQGTITLGADLVITAPANMTVNASNGGSMFELIEFSFGKEWPDGSGYNSSLLNSDQGRYGSMANQSLITLDAAGILLPETQYLKFRNLLAIAS